jgi:uncharacterized protein (TIGR03435 family)
LLAFAYEMRSDLIFGPDWIGSSKYDVAAKAAARVSLSEMKLMLQTLLKERFHVALHGEKRELAVYALLVAKGGPRGLRQPAQGATRGLELQNTSANGTKHWAFHNSSMQNLAGLMSGGMDRPLVDLTGLQGGFDFPFDEPAWDRENTTLAEYTTELVWPAVQDQLGIRVEPRKAPMGVLVIDHVEQPSEN